MLLNCSFHGVSTLVITPDSVYGPSSVAPFSRPYSSSTSASWLRSEGTIRIANSFSALSLPQEAVAFSVTSETLVPTVRVSLLPSSAAPSPVTEYVKETSLYSAPVTGSSMVVVLSTDAATDSAFSSLLTLSALLTSVEVTFTVPA